MKIISGTLKGREVIGFKNPGTRPTMDRVKESLFAMIQDDVPGSVLLDLFSGSGNLALEALSQNAKYAYCNDKGIDAYKIIMKNRERFSLEEKMEVMHLDFQDALFLFARKKITFDLIFLDPPYQTDYIKEALFLIHKYQLLNEGGVIVCESDQMKRIPLDYFSIVKKRQYGDKFVVILK